MILPRTDQTIDDSLSSWFGNLQERDKARTHRGHYLIFFQSNHSMPMATTPKATPRAIGEYGTSLAAEE